MKITLDVRSLALGATLATAMLFVLGATSSKIPTDTLRLRKLVVVDEKGAERIVLAAPVPDPLIKGKRVSRRSAANGLQINDPAGNERGGIVMLDDGSFIVGIDDEQCHERAHFYYIPTKGSGYTSRTETIALTFPSRFRP
jgi:hypothetical protein